MSGERQEYVIRRKGYFYRPGSCGYTASVLEAERYTKSAADLHSGDDCTVHHISEFFTPDDASNRKDDRTAVVDAFNRWEPPTQPRPSPDTSGGAGSQGLCETTLTERFENPNCKCKTYIGNLGPCRDFLAGSEGRCVYCDHERSCHDAVSGGAGERDRAPLHEALAQMMEHEVNDMFFWAKELNINTKEDIAKLRSFRKQIWNVACQIGWEAALSRPSAGGWDEAIEALRPLASLLDLAEDDALPDNQEWFRFDSRVITFGDIRKAARIIRAHPRPAPDAGLRFVRHKKCGTVYRHLGTARLQTETKLTDMDVVEVYQSLDDGELWARRAFEFRDGRFENVPAAPPAAKGAE